MTFKPSVWFPIAVVLTAVNLVAVGFAARPGEPWWHAGSHAALALAFGLWAQRLRQRRAGSGGGDIQERLEALEAEVSRVEALEGDVSSLRQELSEAQERLDFAERLLVKGREKDRAEPQR
ncbi:MAG TPA: hypothetical protein VLB49_09860 [Gemmatimonadales bacterium]|nr:hypothetical protein [Gemmatimonadales bacterium]